MALFSYEAKTEMVAAIGESISMSSFTLHDPTLAERVPRELTSDSERTEFLQAAKQALSNSYFQFMSGRSNPFGAYDTISQHLFTGRTYKLLIEHAKAPINVADTPAVSTQLFLFYVGTLHESLSLADFAAWFAAIFGPLIEAAERVLRATAGNQDDDARVSKKLRMEQQSRYYRSYSLFRLTCNIDAPTQVANGSTADLPRQSNGLETGWQPRRTVLSQWNRLNEGSRRQRASLITRASAFVRRTVSGLLPESAMVPSVALFSPKLDPKPPAMPVPRTSGVSSGAHQGLPVPPPRNTLYSRFPPRPVSNIYKPRHFCPISSQP
ncbi:hypothetical protein C8R44DRAFT_775084 [Mycena epipterygia]|nr:hypothetical protein C8R44DRAFT_775084 [Mycena epipterygia]